MQAQKGDPLFIVRPRMTRPRLHLYGRVAASLVALALSAPGWAAPRSPEQTSTLPPLPQVAQDVASPSAQVRRQALRGLRERGGPETLPLLAALLGDAEIDIREGAVAGVIGVYVQPRANRSINGAAAAFEAARFHNQPWSVPPELSTALVRALADEQPSVRRDAAYAVGIVLTPPVTDAVAFEILASLSDREPSVRVAAARALGRLQVQDAGVPLIGRVNDEDLDVRLASMRALGDLRCERAVVALTDQFTFYVRGVAGRSAISALAAIGHPSKIPLFEAQTTSGYPAHRRAAYEGLARSGGAVAAASRIEAAMVSEKDTRVLIAMAFALASAGRDGIKRVLDALTDRDRSDDALAYLVELGQPHVAAVAAQLSDPDPFVRGQIATALGFIGGPEAVAALKGATGESDLDVRKTISFAQLRLTRTTVVPATGAP
jgi:HEAT repeat protein